MLSVTIPAGGDASPGPIFHDDDARWEAVCRRNRAADGVFLYSVRTTGVYCHPSCAARLPRRENVGFHETRADAERAGFRPCKRCRPDHAPPQADSGGRRKLPLVKRIAAVDRAEVSGQLNSNGCATIGPLLTPEERTDTIG